jgi:cytochrome c-type biogenesis protein CcmE
MKSKHIIAIVVAVIFVGVAAFGLVENKIDYSDFKNAQSEGSRAQISGTWVKEKGANYDPKTNTFSFHMKDKEGIEMPVRFSGAKPNNFEIAPTVVCVGKVEAGVFHASDIQTKCPSKYEGSGGLHPDGVPIPKDATL